MYKRIGSYGTPGCDPQLHVLLAQCSTCPFPPLKLEVWLSTESLQHAVFEQAS